MLSIRYFTSDEGMCANWNYFFSIPNWKTYYYFSEFTDLEVAFDTTKEQLRQAISDEECLNANDEDIFSLYFHGENANDEYTIDDFEDEEKIMEILKVTDASQTYYVDVEFKLAGNEKVQITSETKRQIITGKRNFFWPLEVDTRGGQYELKTLRVSHILLLLLWRMSLM